MSVRSFKTSSIKTGEKRSKFWDQSTVVLNPAFESIASATGTGSSGTITFSSIPSTYQHLQIRAIIPKMTSSGTETNLFYRANNVSTGNLYTYHILAGNGSVVFADGLGSLNSNVLCYVPMASAPGSSGNTVLIADFYNYASTTQNKTVRAFSGYDLNSTSQANILLSSSLFMSTSAITSLSILSASGNFTTDTTFALYGIKAAA